MIPTATLLPDRPRRRHEEDDLQRAVVAFLAVALPDDAMAFAVPNGGQRHPRAAARLKGLGVVAGVPDLAIVWRGRVRFVEMKSARGVLSEAQKQTIRRLHYCGAIVLTCRSLEEVERGLRDTGVPLKATTGPTGYPA